MTTLRTALNGVALLVLATGTANATVITLTQFFSDTLPAPLTAAGDAPILLSRFNDAVLKASIHANCPAGFSCSAVSLLSIDFEISANSSGSLTFNNPENQNEQIKKFPNNAL